MAKEIFTVLPGLTPENSYLIPHKGRGVPFEAPVKCDPLDVIITDPQDARPEIDVKYSPKSSYPRKRLFRAVNKTLVFGRGQKILVSAMPGTGKTFLLTQIAKQLADPKVRCHSTLIMIEERPEENIGVNTINLSFMMSPQDILDALMFHIGKAVRAANEKGSDEVIFIDSLTRLVGIANTLVMEKMPHLPVGSGGYTLQARKFVRQIFGLGQNLQRGSITIIGSALLGTSSAEEIIYKDLKGTSTAEIFVSRGKDKKPIIDPRKSYVRNMEMIK